MQGATAYKISLNDTILAKEITGTTFNEIADGNNRIKILPIVSGDDSFYSKWSEEVQVYKYSKVTNVKYDGKHLTWRGNAGKYSVNINGREEIVTTNTFVYNSQNVDFEVKIKAIGNYSGTYDSEEVVETFNYLESVKNINVNEGVLTWDPVDRAEGYSIKINRVTQSDKLSTNSYYKLPSGQSVDVEILPYNNSGNYFSSWSERKTFYILKTPNVYWNPDMELDGYANKNFYFDMVDSAVGYVVRFVENGKETIHELSETQLFFEHAYDKVGNYEISVQAVANSTDSNYSNSKFSNPIKIERLPAPGRADNDFIVSDPNSVAKGFTVNFKGVNNSTGYSIYKDGKLLQGLNTVATSITDANVLDESVITEQNYTYHIRCLGGVKTIDSTKYVTLPTLTKDALSFNITVCSTPTNVDISGFKLSWSAVGAGDGYVVKYGGSNSISDSSEFDLSTMASGEYSVNVCARGNGADVLASNFSSPINIKRLNAPTNIKIIANDGNGQLVFDRDAFASSFSVYLDNGKENLEEDLRNQMYDLVKESGTVITVVAEANYFNDDHTIYYMSSPASPSKQFIRLSAPIFPEGKISNQKELVWNHSENINTSEYTPTYRVLLNGVEQDVAGTVLNLSTLPAGSYIVQVKAIGEENKYLDSEYSQTFEFKKLPTPKMEIGKNGYSWNNNAEAASYMLEIDGVKVSDGVQVEGGVFNYMPRFTTAGEHIVKLYYVGNGINNVSSNAFEYIQKATILNAPTIEFSYSNDSFVHDGKILVTVVDAIENASGYLYEIGGATDSSANTTFEKTIKTAGKYTIRVKALGGTFDDNLMYYIDSQFTGEESINILTPPNKNTFGINGNGVIKWGLVSGCFGYDYQLSFDGAEFGKIVHTSFANTTDIENFRQYTSIKIRVRASSGTNVSTVNSEWIEWEWINPSVN